MTNFEKSKSNFKKALFERWSAHPSSLRRQRCFLFWIALVPLMLVAVFAAFTLASFDALASAFSHPGRWLILVSCAIAVGLGCALVLCVMNLMGRARVSRLASNADHVPISPIGVVLLAFLWVLPLALSFLPQIPSRLVFLLDLLCFLPLLVLVAWLRAARTPDECTRRESPSRHPVWLIFTMVFAGLAITSFLVDVHGLLSATSFAPYIAGLKPVVLRTALVATLLPMSFACLSLWILLREGGLKEKESLSKKDDESVKETAPKDEGKTSTWKRFTGWIRGICSGKKANSAQTTASSVPPTWLTDLIDDLPDVVRAVSTDGLEPKPMSVERPDDPDDSSESEPLSALMGLQSDSRPTLLQTRYFSRFQTAYQEAQIAAAKGNSTSADIVLCGQIGSGRTEVLLSTALFSALTRGQRVLYVCQDAIAADKLCTRLRQRIAAMMMDSFVFCGRISEAWTVKCMSGLAGDESVLPYDILVVTPDEIERNLFENDKAIDQASIDRLRDLIQSYEVVLIDDFMEMDVAERAHFAFIINKFRLLLSLRCLMPQFVVVMPELEAEGVNEFAGKLFGQTDFKAENVITLRPRKCEGGWKIVLTAPNGVRPNDVCETLVRKCVEGKLKVVLYRKGISPQQCDDLARRLRGSAPKDGSSGDVRVIARCDDALDGFSPAAVFYLASLCGDAGISLLLNMGGGDTVYIEIKGQDPGGFGTRKIIPVLPDFSAVSLRVYHLKSVLRFIRTGDPMDDAAWSRFGVSIHRQHLTPVRMGKSDPAFVIWLQDKWDEPAKYDLPLWPYLVLTSKGNVNNAGSGGGLSTLPVLNDDIYQLGGTNRILMGCLSGRQASDVRSSVAEWVDDRFVAPCDLAHVETLVFGRTVEGDVNGGDATNVYTVKTVEPSGNGYCMALSVQRWNGDGTDKDRPIRHFSWTIEPGSVPKSLADTAAFLFYSVPECRGVNRSIKAELRGLVNAYGEVSTLNPSRPYEYQSYISALVLAPKKLDRKDGIAQLQAASVGTWNTDLQDGFSVVLTHLFTGVMRRLAPDFGYYALCPVFYPAGRESSVGGACVWVIEPANSGKTVQDILFRCFANGAVRRSNPLLDADEEDRPVDAKQIVELMQQALRLARAGETLESKLHWLRSYSRHAYDIDLDSDAVRTALADDFRRAEEILQSVMDRIESGRIPDDSVAPPIGCDANWILTPKSFDISAVDTIDWKVIGELPTGFGTKRGATHCSWTYDGVDFHLDVGFMKLSEQKRYIDLINDYSSSRVGGFSMAEYDCNDPYSAGVDELYSQLKKMFDEQTEKQDPSAFAEFLLAFVQSGVDYKRDPKDKKSDWPRFPSEVCAYGGGDCEDSSILYAALLRRAKIGNALLFVPEHAAVGVEVNLRKTQSRKIPIVYEWMGHSYVYAETACSAGSQRSLGEETTLIPSAETIPADIVPTPLFDGSATLDVAILNAEWNRRSIQVTVAAKPEFQTGESLVVLCYARAKKGVYDAPSRASADVDSNCCIGSVDLDVFQPCEMKMGDIPLAAPSLPAYWIDVFVCEKNSGAVHAHYVGVAHLSSPNA